MAQQPGPLPPPSIPWVDQPGTPSLSFRQYFLTLDRAARALVTAINSLVLGKLVLTLQVAADDAAAATAGVPVGGLYRTPATGVAPHTISQIQIRVN